MTHEVVFHPLARTDLFDLYTYIDEHSGPDRAGSFIDRIEVFCSRLTTLPDRGAPRNDLGISIRTLSMQRRVLVAYRVSNAEVMILRVLYAGRDVGADDFPD